MAEAKAKTKKKAAAKKKPAAKAPSAAQVAKRLDKVVESTNDVVTELRSDMQANQEAVMTALKALGTSARDNPVVIPKRLESEEQDLGTDDDIVDGVIEKARVGNIEFGEFKEKAVIEAFMNEDVIIQIHDTPDIEMPQIFDVAVNGKKCLFRHGETKKIKRYFLEGLARAKPTTYSNEERTGADGIRRVHNNARRGLRYPFNVVRDENPIGAGWLKAVLAQP